MIFIFYAPIPCFPGAWLSGSCRPVLHAIVVARIALPSAAAHCALQPGRTKGCWLKRMADGQRVEFVRVQDPTVRALKLIRGEIDLLQGDMNPEMFTWLKTRPDLAVERTDGDALAYLGFNMQDPIVGRREVREAIACAIDRDTILRFLLAGTAHEGAALLPAPHWASVAAPEVCHYDPQRARALVTKITQEMGKPLTISFKTSKDPLRLRVATVIQDQLQKVGITLQIQSHDWGTFYADIKAGRVQMFSLQWVGLKMPDIFRYAFHSSMVPPQGANRGRFVNPEIDRLIEQAESTEDLATQAAIYRQIQVKLLNELAYVPLWYQDTVLARRRELVGYRIATDGNFDGLSEARLVRDLQH